MNFFISSFDCQQLMNRKINQKDFQKKQIYEKHTHKIN